MDKCDYVKLRGCCYTTKEMSGIMGEKTCKLCICRINVENTCSNNPVITRFELAFIFQKMNYEWLTDAWKKKMPSITSRWKCKQKPQWFINLSLLEWFIFQWSKNIARNVEEKGNP